MTQPHEVTVTRQQELEYASMLGFSAEDAPVVAEIIKKIIAARVPDAVADQGDDSYPSFGVWEAGHNALRAAVLKGPQT